ncbi:MAG: hypothetical protein Q9M50_02815 [Methylococcales bacterium]|nr:hypothetical protein [Methylococcales bacterium]
MNPKLKFPILIIGIVLLLVFQAKGVMPVVYDVVSSDIFLEDSPDEASQMSISNEMTAFAFNHCNTYIKEDIDTDFSVNFSEKPTNVWSMGNYQYIVNAEIEITPADGVSFMRTYVCRINYSEKDDLSAANTLDNWSVNGLSGLDNL